METYEILGRKYPVTGYATSKLVGTVPVVALRLMEDAEWSRLTQANAVHNYTHEFGHPPETVEEAVQWQRKEAAEAVRRLEERRHGR